MNATYMAQMEVWMGGAGLMRGAWTCDKAEVAGPAASRFNMSAHHDHCIKMFVLMCKFHSETVSLAFTTSTLAIRHVTAAIVLNTRLYAFKRYCRSFSCYYRCLGTGKSPFLVSNGVDDDAQQCARFPACGRNHHL